MNTETDNSKHDSNESHGADQSWFERNVNLIIGGLVVACLLTLVAQAICGPVFGMPFYDEHHHPHFPQEEWFGFQAIFGFVAFAVVVFLGTMLRKVIMRKEDYYDS